MANFGLIAYGSYLPFQAISRQSIFDQIGWIQGGLKAYAKGKRSYADWDEDAVTLAVAAARQLLKTADNTQVQQLSFAMPRTHNAIHFIDFQLLVEVAVDQE